MSEHHNYNLQQWLEAYEVAGIAEWCEHEALEYGGEWPA